MSETIRTTLEGNTQDLRSEFRAAQKQVASLRSEFGSLGGEMGRVTAVNQRVVGGLQKIDAAAKPVERSLQRAAAAAKLAREEFAQETRVLQLQAGGNNLGANVARRELAIKREAAAIQRRLQVSDQAALTLARQRVGLETQIAGARRSQAQAARAEAVASRQSRSGQNIRGGGMAVLEFSRALEDAQYGIRGVLNNIPGLIFALGGTAGLAGAVSVGAVVLANIVPKLFDVSDETEKLTGKLQREVRAEYEVARARRESASAAERSARAVEAYGEAVERGLASDRNALAIQRQIARERDAERKREDALAREQLLTRVAGVEAGVSNPEERAAEVKRLENQAAAEQAARDAARRQEDLAAVAKERDAAETALLQRTAKRDAELQRLAAQREAAEQEAMRRESEAAEVAGRLAEELAKLTKFRGRKQSDFASPQEFADELVGVGQFDGGGMDVVTANNIIALRRRELDLRGAVVQADEEAKEAAEKLAAASEVYGRQLNELQQDLQKVADGLKTLRKESEESAQKESLRARRRDLEEQALLNRQKEAEAKEAAAASQSGAGDAARQTLARGRFAGELLALRREASGDAEGAAEIREALRIRQEAVQLQESLGLSEEKSLRLARERVRLEREVRRAKEEGQRSGRGEEETARRRIRLYNAEESAERRAARQAMPKRGLSVGRVEGARLQGSGGLHPGLRAGQDRQAAARQEADFNASKVDPTLPPLEQLVELNRNMARVWERLAGA